MTHRAGSCVFEIVSNQHNLLTLRGIGGMTITNAAEKVVKYLLNSKELIPDMRLLYYDTDGRLDELLFNDDGFINFKFLPQQGMQ